MQRIKSLTLLLVLSVCTCTELLGVDVIFQDVDLEIAIREVLEKPEGPITDTNMALIESLTISERSILDLTGLEYTVNLVYLDLSKNLIIDTSPLSGLAQLETLYLFDNLISDFSPLAGLTQLTSLDLEFNFISDLSPLTGLIELKFLNLDNNEISNLNPLAGLTQLTGLFIDNSQINDISPLSGLTQLELLTLLDYPKVFVSPSAIEAFRLLIDWCGWGESNSRSQLGRLEFYH